MWETFLSTWSRPFSQRLDQFLSQDPQLSESIKTCMSIKLYPSRYVQFFLVSEVVVDGWAASIISPAFSAMETRKSCISFKFGSVILGTFDMRFTTIEMRLSRIAKRGMLK